MVMKIQNNKDNILKTQNIYYTKVRNKVMLSEQLSIKLIKNIHKNLCHIGIQQMQKTLSPLYTARNLTRNIKEICKSCSICMKNRSRRQENIVFMSHLSQATKPFEIVSIGTIGGFGGSRSTKKYLHLLVDHFTRYAFILTSKTQSDI